jgi:yecA family protein
VAKEKWLPLIFKDRMPSRVEGSPESRATATIMARYAEVRQLLNERPQDYQPIFMHDLGRFIIRPWAIGFMLGLGQNAEAWTSLLVGPRRQELRPILAHSELGRPLLPELTDIEVARIAAESEVNEIAGAVVKAHAYFTPQRQPRKLDALRRPTRRSL